MLATARQMIPPDIDALSARYATITVPTLLIWGRQDPIVPLNVGERLVKILPSARLEIIDACGHCPHEEHPEQTARLMNQFLDGLG
jgi:pimeloyl-ACP methyl ester carboxylesterase